MSLRWADRSNLWTGDREVTAAVGGKQWCSEGGCGDGIPQIIWKGYGIPQIIKCQGGML
jgi:hypothetical protein